MSNRKIYWYSNLASAVLLVQLCWLNGRPAGCQSEKDLYLSGLCIAINNAADIAYTFGHIILGIAALLMTTVIYFLVKRSENMWWRSAIGLIFSALMAYMMNIDPFNGVQIGRISMLTPVIYTSFFVALCFYIVKRVRTVARSVQVRS